jgi:hypothetical protein
VTIETLPFDSYPEGGRLPLGKPKGDLARRGYGRDVLAWCGFACAYCGLDMSVFEGWLQLSVDHVIPQQSVANGFPSAWVLDATNIVACCRSCNDLFNRDPHVDAVPESLEAFYDLRDRLYLARRARIVERRAHEREWFEENVLRAAAKAKEPAAGPLYSRAWLQSSGFEGFVPVSSLRRALNTVPGGPGVYAVLRDAATPPRFLASSKGGWFKTKDPTVSADLLRGRWHGETPILYVGKADSLRARIRALVRFAAGEPVGHWGGRYLWQVEDSQSFLVSWREAEKPRELERELLADFAAHFGGLPFANIVG